MKPPAFQFYPADFLVGIMGMSDEEIGIYMKMLAFQWLKGSLPNSPKTIKNLINSKRIPSDSVMEKFQVCEDGNLRNARLEKEREKQESFKQSRIENANKRWGKECTSNARAKSSICKTDALHSSSISSSTDIKEKPPAILPDEWKKMTRTERCRRKVNFNDETMIRIGSWFKQKPETLWSIADAAALQELAPEEEDLALIGEHYSYEIENNGYRFKTIETLLNKWPAARAKANAFFDENPNLPRP